MRTSRTAAVWIAGSAFALGTIGVLAYARLAADDNVVEIGTLSPESELATDALAAGTPLPDVELEDLDGGSVRTKDLIGMPLVLNFWYSACPPCRRELPDFAGVADELSGKVRFVGINPVDSAEQAESFASRYGMRYDNLRDPDGAALVALGVVSFPTTLIVDKDGVVRLQHTGAMSADQLRAAIADQFPEVSAA